MKDRIIQKSLELIDREKSARSVGLREIARSVGCSAPNIYNHYKNLNALLNDVMQYIINDYMETISAAMKTVDRAAAIFWKAVDTLVSYALRYEGRFYFIHFEKVDVTITEDTFRKGRDTGEYMASLIGKSSGGLLTPVQSFRISGIIHNYILGELSQFLADRRPSLEKARFKQTVIANSKKILDLFVRTNPAEVQP